MDPGGQRVLPGQLCGGTAAVLDGASVVVLVSLAAALRAAHSSQAIQAREVSTAATRTATTMGRLFQGSLGTRVMSMVPASSDMEKMKPISRLGLVYFRQRGSGELSATDGDGRAVVQRNRTGTLQPLIAPRAEVHPGLDGVQASLA